MKMTVNKPLRAVPQIKDEKLCRLYSRIGKFTADLSAPKDAASAKQLRLRSAPVELLPLIF